MERGINLRVGTSASVRIHSPSKDRMAMEGQSATCPFMELLLMGAI